MARADVRKTLQLLVRMIYVVAGGAVLSTGLSGCLVAGYRSGGGWFVWPGGFGLLMLVLVLLFFLRRGR